jgi:hypothetical protein
MIYNYNVNYFYYKKPDDYGHGQTWLLWSNLTAMVKPDCYGQTWLHLTTNLTTVVKPDYYGQTWLLWSNLTTMVKTDYYDQNWLFGCAAKLRECAAMIPRMAARCKTIGTP